MLNCSCRTVSRLARRLAGNSMLLVFPILGLGLSRTPMMAQSDVGGGDPGACVLKDHVYSCNGAAFQTALRNATTVAVETHNADGVARAQLKDLVTKKLAKTIAPAGSPVDLLFLLIPVGDSGVIYSGSGGADLGTLRVYSATPDGERGHLLWAETFSSQQYMPWPAVVHGLILQFQSRFHIK